MNNVSLVGRPTRDPELRYTAGGVPVCTFILAVDRDFKNKEGKREADFIFVKVWNKAAEVAAEYASKGRLISVTGRIATDSRQEKDGRRRYWTEVVTENIGLLGPRKSEGAEGGGDFVPVEVEVDNPFEEAPGDK